MRLKYVNILFFILIKILNTDMACDIGSMDGLIARCFRRILPNARIIAFEANPNNIAMMQRYGELHKNRIEIQQKAVWNHEGSISFYIEKMTPGADETWRRGISSTRSRSRSSLGTIEIEAPSVRLDDFILGLDKTPRSVALWIDVEGAAYEVIEGLDNIKDIIKVIQVEVETQEVWPGQKLESSVEALLNQMGFIKLTRGSQDLQHDLIFINSKTFKASPFKFKAIKILAFITSQMLRLAARSPFLISHIKQVVLGDLGREDGIEF